MNHSSFVCGNKGFNIINYIFSLIGSIMVKYTAPDSAKSPDIYII